MVTKNFLRQIGLYQIVLILSRLAGISRDLIIIFVIGASLLTDQLFFLFSFSDILMSFLVGGGAVLYLSNHYSDKNNSHSIWSVAFSSVLLYFLVTLLFICFEVFSGAAVGKVLYANISGDHQLKNAYLFSLIALFFSLPMVVANSIFLHKDKIYLQPLTNVFFTVLIILLTLSVYYTNTITVFSIALILIVASIFRMVISLGFIRANIPEKRVFPLSVIREFSFYKDLILSGISIGVLILLPYIFRGKLPSFGEGLYASSAIYFKFNDLIQAFFIIPVATLVLKYFSSSTNRLGYIKLIVFALLFSAVSAVGIIFCIKLIKQLGIDIPIIDVAGDMYIFIAINLVFSSMAYVISLISIKKKKSIVSTIASLISLIFLILSTHWFEVEAVENYFYLLYVAYTVFIISTMVSLAHGQG